MLKQNNYIIEGPYEEIIAIFSDLAHYGNLHPLIKKVEKLASSSNGQLYRITERPFAWIPLNIEYKTRVKIDNNKIDYQITGIPLTKAQINYKFVLESKGRIKIEFLLTINSKAIGKSLLLKKMIRAQDQLMEAIQIDFSKN